MTDPKVEMAFFTSPTLTGENLNTGAIEACLGNWSFSRVSFLVCTWFNHKNKEEIREMLKISPATPSHKNRQITHHLVGPSNFKGSSLGKQSLIEGVKFPELDCGRLGLSLLLDGGLPQLVSLVLHLLEDLGVTGIN